MCFGCLGLSRQDLWRLTLGEIQDMITGYNYRRYLDSRRDAEHAIFVAACFGGKIGNIEELCGRWANNRVMTIQEANEFYTNLAKRRAADNGVFTSAI